jgi:hypothetical protein
VFFWGIGGILQGDLGFFRFVDVSEVAEFIG